MFWTNRHGRLFKQDVNIIVSLNRYSFKWAIFYQEALRVPFRKVGDPLVDNDLLHCQCLIVVSFPCVCNSENLREAKQQWTDVISTALWVTDVTLGSITMDVCVRQGFTLLSVRRSEFTTWSNCLRTHLWADSARSSDPDVFILFNLPPSGCQFSLFAWTCLPTLEVDKAGIFKLEHCC